MLPLLREQLGIDAHPMLQDLDTSGCFRGDGIRARLTPRTRCLVRTRCHSCFSRFTLRFRDGGAKLNGYVAIGAQVIHELMGALTRREQVL